MNINLAAVKGFYTNQENLILIATLEILREKAVETRKKVDSYIDPLLALRGLKNEEGNVILKAGDLYLCKDDEGCDAFYKACDVAHKENGFDMEPGFCPALVAENAVFPAERNLIESFGNPMGVDFSTLWKPEDRKALLDLIVEGPNAN